MPFWKLVCRLSEAAEDYVEFREIKENNCSSTWQMFSSIFCLPNIVLNAVRYRVLEVKIYPGGQD